MSIRECAKRIVVPVAAITLLVSIGLWVWNSGIYYRSLPTPGCVIRLPFFMLQTCANDEGIHFLALKHRANQVPTIHFRRSLGNAGYHHGCVVNVLGLVIAVLPTAFDGGDYFISPHIALVLPYWLLVVGAIYVLVMRTRVGTWVVHYCRPSKVAGAMAGFVCVVFLMLNFVPSAWRPGAAIRPQTISEWATLTLQPDTAHSEIMLVYGYPFPCYRKAIRNGESVNLFYGADVGWEPHRAMENICVAAFTAFFVVFVTQWLRMTFGTSQYSTSPNKRLNVSGETRPARSKVFRPPQR